MGGGGGGASGQVSYPEYLMTLHEKFLNQKTAHTVSVPTLDPDTGEPVLDPETGEPLYHDETTYSQDDINFSMVGLLNDAYATSPYATAVSYTGKIELGTNIWTVGAALEEILNLDLDANTLFNNQFSVVAQSVQELFNLESIQSALTQDSNQAEEEKQRLLKIYTGKQLESGTVFSSAYVQGYTNIIDAKMRSVQAAGGDRLSKGILQLGQNKLTNTLNLIETQWMNFKVSKTSYHMAIEGCKLTILNEREYTEQNEYYLKHSAQWRFECFQAGFNGLAVNMGKRMTWVASPDLPKWAIDAGSIGMVLGGDIVSAYMFRKSKKFRTVAGGIAMGGGQGAMAGSSFGPLGTAIGAIVGGIAGGIMSYTTYSEGEWR